MQNKNYFLSKNIAIQILIYTLHVNFLVLSGRVIDSIRFNIVKYL